MTTNEILDVLAENESKLFYAFCHDPKNDGLKIAHAAAKMEDMNWRHSKDGKPSRMDCMEKMDWRR